MWCGELSKKSPCHLMQLLQVVGHSQLNLRGSLSPSHSLLPPKHSDVCVPPTFASFQAAGVGGSFRVWLSSCTHGKGFSRSKSVGLQGWGSGTFQGWGHITSSIHTGHRKRQCLMAVLFQVQLTKWNTNLLGFEDTEVPDHARKPHALAHLLEENRAWKLLCHYSSYLAWLPTSHYFYPLITLICTSDLYVSPLIFSASHMSLFFPVPIPYPLSLPSSLLASICMVSVTFSLQVFCSSQIPSPKDKNTIIENPFCQSQAAAAFFFSFPGCFHLSNPTLAGCRSDLGGTACPPKLPGGCETWQAGQPFSYLAYTCRVPFVWSMSIRLYRYLWAELNSSRDAVGKGAVSYCTADAVNWSNCCLTPLCGKCESSRKPPQDDGTVMVTDGMDGVWRSNHAAHRVSNEQSRVAQHGAVPRCCDGEHLQRVMLGTLNEKKNICEGVGDRYVKSIGKIILKNTNIHLVEWKSWQTEQLCLEKNLDIFT